MVFERLNGPDVAPDESAMMVRERTGSTHVMYVRRLQAIHGGSWTRWTQSRWRISSTRFMMSLMRRFLRIAGVTVKLMAVGQVCIMREMSVIRIVGRLRIGKGILGRTGVNLHFEIRCLSTGYGRSAADSGVQ